MIVETPSRLHMGIIDLSRSFKRQYGALGVMIKGGFKIDITPSEKFEIEADGKDKREIKEVYQKLSEVYDLEKAYGISVERAVPRHIGLGSTTQLKMGTAAGVLELESIDYDTTSLAKVIGRSRYSAIGTYGFTHGGFILEGGKENKEEVPPLIAHMDIPDSWRFVIVCPKDIHSFDEVEEKPIMESMKVDRKYPSMISHHIVMGVLPALVSTDIEGFGHHISKIQRLVGRSFAEPQGGIFHPIIADVIEKLEVLTYGAGQSSWGPTGYGITDIENAEDVKDEILGYLDDKELDSHVWIAEPENEGAHFSE